MELELLDPVVGRRRRGAEALPEDELELLPPPETFSRSLSLISLALLLITYVLLLLVYFVVADGSHRCSGCCLPGGSIAVRN